MRLSGPGWKPDEPRPFGRELAPLVASDLLDLGARSSLVVVVEAGHPAVDGQDVADRVVTSDLTTVADEEAAVPHPIGELMDEPGAALRPIIVRSRCPDQSGQAVVPMDAFRDVRDPETVRNAQ